MNLTSKKPLVCLLGALLICSCTSTHIKAPVSRARFYPLRLHPGQDLRLALEQFQREQGLLAASIVSAVGSLNQVNLRLANQSQGKTFAGPLEMVSLSGTLSKDGSHLHISVADAQGRTIGGHLLADSTIYTTAELVIAEYPQVEMLREHDSKTGHKELNVLQRH